VRDLDREEIQGGFVYARVPNRNDERFPVTDKPVIDKPVIDKPRTAPPKKKQPAASETSLSIAEQTEAFFKSGGTINKIKSGVSGQQSVAGPKHISLGNKPRNT
jgi:hypothetical protein